MKKYEIVENSRDLVSRHDFYRGCTLDAPRSLPIILESYNEKEEALEALKNYKTEFLGVHLPVIVIERYVEENEYNEDGEWIDGGYILEYAKFE